MKTLACIIFFVFVFTVHCCSQGADTNVFHITKLPAEGVVLDKGWKFTVGDDPAYASAEYDDNKWQAIDPSTDIHYLKYLREAEIGWFRLHLKVDSSVVNKPLAMKIVQAGASEIYLNGELIQHLGVVSQKSKDEIILNPNNNPFSFYFKTGSWQVLAIRYSFTKKNPYFNFFGSGNPCLVSTISPMEESIKGLLYDKSYKALIEFGKVGFLLFLGLLHLFFYFSYPQQHTNLYYSIFTLSQSAGYLLAYFSSFPNIGSTSFLIRLFELIMWLLFAVWSNIAVYSFANRKMDKWLWLLIVSSFFAILLSKWPYQWGGSLWVLPIMFSAFNACRVSWLAMRDRIEGSRVVFVGWLVWTFVILKHSLTLYQIIVLPQGINSVYLNDIIFNIGVLAEALPFSILLATEYAQTHKSLRNKIVQVEMLSQKAIMQEQEKQRLLAIQNETLEQQVTERTAALQHSLEELKATQAQLIQSEKMASLGQLTAGIAHEIQNPLNFVNNFSEVNKELIEELRSEKNNPQVQEEIINDIEQNLNKIIHHGKRADSVVKGMLQHSRASSGKKELTDINALVDESLRLSYHGIRAKDKDFNAVINTDFNNSIGKINIVPQDISRVLLNLLNNAFYAVHERKKSHQPANKSERTLKESKEYEPTVWVATKHNCSPSGDEGITITVQDNGKGIPQNIVDKIFQPFFTTKPTGQGTGLGLSLSYDIIKAHGGEIKVESKEGEETVFMITLPINN